MKHRHKYQLIITRLMIGKKGLLWVCECGKCLEFRKKPNYKKATEILLKLV